MSFFKYRKIPATIATAFILISSTIFTPTGFAQVSSAKPEECGWVCTNLKQTWNYMFHPERVNQCRPRGLEIDKKLEELTRQAFTRDDPSIPHYCGDPFSSAE